jgi:hypothetical protein
MLARNSKIKSQKLKYSNLSSTGMRVRVVSSDVAAGLTD